MAETTLAAVLAELAGVRAELAGQRRRLARWERRERVGRARRRALPALALVALLAFVPLATLAATPFGDLNPGSPHNANIEALYAAGITRGCLPDAEYCPNGNVTREEMASFLARTAGLGGNPAVARAKTAEVAGDAALLGGQPPGFYQPAGQPIASATNAQLLGGRAPGELVRAAEAKNATPLTLTVNAQGIAAVTLTAPSAGFVLVVVAANAFTGNAGGCPCDVALDVNADAFAGGTLASPAAQIGLTTTKLFAVEAGQRTFTVSMAADRGSAVVKANARIVALFVPFGPHGAAP